MANDDLGWRVANGGIGYGAANGNVESLRITDNG